MDKDIMKNIREALEVFGSLYSQHIEIFKASDNEMNRLKKSDVLNALTTTDLENIYVGNCLADFENPLLSKEILLVLNHRQLEGLDQNFSTDIISTLRDFYLSSKECQYEHESQYAALSEKIANFGELQNWVEEQLFCVPRSFDEPANISDYWNLPVGDVKKLTEYINGLFPEDYADLRDEFKASLKNRLLEEPEEDGEV